MQITDETRKLALTIGVAVSVAFSSTALVLAATGGDDGSGGQFAGASARPAIAQQDGSSTGVAPTQPNGGTAQPQVDPGAQGTQSAPPLQSGTS